MNDISTLPRPVAGATLERQANRRPPQAAAMSPGGPPPEPAMPEISAGFGSIRSFELMQRQAIALSRSDRIPTPYRAIIPNPRKKWENIDNPNAIANCMVAITMAERMKTDVITVMQNLDVVEGRPTWRGQFVIALVAGCGLFRHPLRFDFTIEPDEKEFTYEEVFYENNERFTRTKKVMAPVFSCVAWTFTLDGHRVESEAITTEMVIAEGWYTKPGSKWRTMLKQMACYRSGAFFGRIHCPHVLYGLMTDDEANDISRIYDAEPDAAGSWQVRADEEGAAEEVKPTSDASDAPADGTGTPQLTHETHQTVDGLLGTTELREPAPITTAEPEEPPPTKVRGKLFGDVI
jgi:hypothetical protein